MNNKLFEDLRNKLEYTNIQQDLEKIHNKRFVFTFTFIGIFLLIVIGYNSLSSALLGLPPLGVIAGIDHQGEILLLLERISLGVIAVAITIPFFSMLAFDKLGANLSENEILEREQAIKKQQADIDKTMSWVTAILVVLTIITVSYIATHAAILGILAIPVSAAIITTAYLLRKMIRHMVTESYLGNNSQGDIKGDHHKSSDIGILAQILAYLHKLMPEDKQKTKEEAIAETKALVKDSVAKLSHINFQSVSAESVYQSLLTHLYQKQLARTLKRYAENSDNLNDITFGACYAGNEDNKPKLYSNLALLDSYIQGKTGQKFNVFQNYKQLIDEVNNAKDEDKTAAKEKLLAVIRAKHAFRKSITDSLTSGEGNEVTNALALLYYAINSEKTNEAFCMIDSYFTTIGLDNYEVNSLFAMEADKVSDKDKTNKAIVDAIIAELAEEKLLICENNGTFSNPELQAELLKKRLAARDQLDAEIANTLEIDVSATDWASIIGQSIGALNAIVNGVIIAAVTSSILSNILPALILGFAISNPIAIYAIMALAFVSGFYASFTITKDSVVKVCKNIGFVWYQRHILESYKSYNNLSYTQNTIILLASVGVAILTGLQVMHLLIPFGATLAVASSIFISGMTLIAGASLFARFVDDLEQKKAQKAEFLELNFKNEHEVQKSASQKETIWYCVSVALGLAVTALVWSQMHIFAFAVLTGMGTFLASEILSSLVINNYHGAKKEYIKREVCGKFAVFSTALCSMCFFISTVIGITALVPGNLGIIIALLTALCIASLYSKFVWAAGASPDNYWPAAFPTIQNESGKAKTAEDFKPTVTTSPGHTNNNDNDDSPENADNKTTSKTTGCGIMSLLGF